MSSSYDPAKISLRLLKRAELQKLCKEYEIKGANQKNEVLINLIQAHVKQDGGGLLVMEDEPEEPAARPPSPPPARAPSRGRNPPSSTAASSNKRGSRKKASPAPERTNPDKPAIDDEVLMVETAEQPEAESSVQAARRNRPPPQISPSRPLSPVLSPSQPPIARPQPRPNGAASTSTDADLLARLPELVALLPSLQQLPSLIPTLTSISARVDSSAAAALARHTALQSSLDTRSASLDNLWGEFGSVDTRLNNVESTLGTLQGSVNNLWTELGALDQEKTGFVRVDDVQRTVRTMEQVWDDKLGALRRHLTVSAPVAAPSRSDPIAAASSTLSKAPTASGSRLPSSSLGKHARSSSTSSTSMPPPSLAGPSSTAYPSGLGHPSVARDADGHASKRQRVVSEMAVEGLLGDDDDDNDDALADSSMRSPNRPLQISSPVRPHPPSTPPPRASPSLTGPDPTFTPSTSTSATKAKANPTPQHQLPTQAFPLFATSPRPPKETPTSPTHESPRRVVGQSATASAMSLTPGRTLFGAETPRSRAARGATGLTPAQRRLASDSHPPFGAGAAASGSTTSPPQQAGARTLNYDIAQQATTSRPTGLALLPSLPLTTSDASSAAGSTPTDPHQPLSSSSSSASATLVSAGPFPFPIHPTPPPSRPAPRGVPPTPPAPRTMFGTERDRDDRFGDDEA